MIVLGVDVGIQVCGYVFCDIIKQELEIIEEAEIKPKRNQLLPQKLKFIFTELNNKVLKYKPEAVILENLYSNYRHPTTLGILAQVKGIVSLMAAQNCINIFEYSPTRARKSFLGRGNSDSTQVKKMAENILGRNFVSTHTADAYSLIIAFTHTQKIKNLSIILDDNTYQSKIS